MEREKTMASKKDRMPVKMSRMHKIALMFSAAANPMTQAMVRIYNARLAKEAEAKAEGMITLKQDGYLKVLEGITSIEEVLRVAQE